MKGACLLGLAMVAGLPGWGVCVGQTAPRLQSRAADPDVIPVAMQGAYTVVRNLSEPTLGCFDPKDTPTLIGVHVALREKDLLWNRRATTGLDPRTSVISSNAFRQRYGKLPQELGLAAAPVTILDVHPTEGIPVNALVAVDRSTLLINACNIWLVAERTGP